VTVRHGWVKCGRCQKVYRCVPKDDHYLAAGAEDGDPRVCFRCLLIITRENLVEAGAGKEKERYRRSEGDAVADGHDQQQDEDRRQ
jgi:hypothetical protein